MPLPSIYRRHYQTTGLTPNSTATTTTTTTTTTATTSFSLFPLLPAEIRLTIYQLSLPGARLVPINYQSQTYTGGLPSSSPTKSAHRGCTSPAPIPALLHVCREARAVAREHYRLSFQLAGPPGVFLPKVWFGSDGQDVLYIGPRPGRDVAAIENFKHFVHLVGIVDRQELARVRRLAVHEGLFVEVDQGSRRHQGVRTERSVSRRLMRRDENSLSTDLSLREFWSCIREKFTNLNEIVFVCEGQDENDIVDIETIFSARHFPVLSNKVLVEESFNDLALTITAVDEDLNSRIARAAADVAAATVVVGAEPIPSRRELESYTSAPTSTPTSTSHFRTRSQVWKPPPWGALRPGSLYSQLILPYDPSIDEEDDVPEETEEIQEKDDDDRLIQRINAMKGAQHGACRAWEQVEVGARVVDRECDLNPRSAFTCLISDNDTDTTALSRTDVIFRDWNHAAALQLGQFATRKCLVS